MPTGYTAKLYEGTEPQSFEQFALEAARAMGAAIEQRDAAPGPIADEYEPSTYYQERLGIAEKRLAELSKFTDEQWAAQELEDRQRGTEGVNEAISQAAERRVRYEQMLAQVESWEPPTSEHENFKEFMRGQITESIKFDCSTTYLTVPQPKTVDQYKVEQLDIAEKTIERAREGWEGEQARTADRNKWVRDLRNSLSVPLGVSS